MKITSSTYKILGNESLQKLYKEYVLFIEEVGRTCYQSKVKENSGEDFVRMLISRGHEAMLEHKHLTIRFTVDRGVTHEQVRHRIAAFAQESTRYCNYSKGKFENEITVIDITPGIALDKSMKSLSESKIVDIIHEWTLAMQDAERHYMNMVSLGASPQIARSVLSHSTKAELIVTCNIREWRHILNLRAASDAHPQMREVMIPLLRDLQLNMPAFFEDIKIT